jgi:hypothetical protein
VLPAYEALGPHLPEVCVCLCLYVCMSVPVCL